MGPVDLLVDGFGRVADVVTATLDGASLPALAWRPDDGSNSIGWLVWHLTRIQDDHLADAFGGGQVWVEDGFVTAFGLPFDAATTGFGQSARDVAAVQVDVDRLAAYNSATHDRTVALLAGLDAGDLDRVVDDRWDPPVTLAVRLVSVLGDDLQHAGQAAYVRGLWERATHA